MPLEKLYYQDQYIRHFTSKVQKSEMDEKQRTYVVLDETAFYPTGGGQPHDTGRLNDKKVYDVEEIDGEVRHYIDEPIEMDEDCVGEIDWERRFDHMQQHAGQHILSATFENKYGCKTDSFHLGKETCSIDINTEQLTKEVAFEVEKIANNIILENRPIETKWVTENELSNYPLRKGLSVSENIRLVIIPDIDYIGCGGTHPNSTGQVSAIKILHWEKQKKNTRVFFVCGDRVLNQLHNKQRVIQQLTSLLSAPQEQLEDTTNRVLQLNKQLEKTNDELKRELIKYESQTLIDKAKLMRNNVVVQAIYEDRPISELQLLAKTIVTGRSNVIVLLITENEYKLQIVCTRTEDINMNMNNMVKQVLSKINGKGGGNASIAQGGGEKILPVELLMEELITIGNTLQN